jgi:hypothetical protein
MSLLDDVSIVVTPNGYKAGELYAVVPVPTEGAEEVTNGDFATDSDWNKDTGWTISGGTANKTGSVASNFYQYSVFTSGERYKLTFDVVHQNLDNYARSKFGANGRPNQACNSLLSGY